MKSSRDPILVKRRRDDGNARRSRNSCAAWLLFVGTLRDRPGVSLFVAFGLALLFTIGALVAFLIEMLLASRGLRDQANYANEVGEMRELAAEGVGEPSRSEPV